METTPMSTNKANVLTGEGWRDSIEALVRGRIRGLIEEILEEELSDALGRARYTRRKTDRRWLWISRRGLAMQEGCPRRASRAIATGDANARCWARLAR